MNPYTKAEYDEFPELDLMVHPPMTRCIWTVDYGIAKPGEMVLFMGEIPNMPGHCVFADPKGKVHWGYHPDNVKVMPE